MNLIGAALVGTGLFGREDRCREHIILRRKTNREHFSAISRNSFT